MRYIECEGQGLWMLPLMITLSGTARRVASNLDDAKRSEANADVYLKKLVEIQRDLFQKLSRERARRPGYVWVCCELLRAYFKLGQVSQCSFLLKAVDQSLSKDGFNPMELPGAISVCFYYYWGKHCVFEGNLVEADKKLSWAFAHCPPNSRAHRRKVLLYLVPCKLRLGVLPTQELLDQHDLCIFTDIVRSLREGNVMLFTEKMEEHTADFIKMGTYLLMMKLKFMVLRNLCKGIHTESTKKSPGTKLDLGTFEHIFEWQGECDAFQTSAVLSNLINQNALKGYLSHEHRKVVFAKDNPFPPPSKWKI
jgi:hypothetical protein